MKMTKEIFQNLCKEDLAYLYIVKCFDEEEQFYKIGITSKENPDERFSSIPYEIEVIEFYSHPSPTFIMDLERKLLSLQERYKPLKQFGGYSECILDVNTSLEYLESLEWMTELKPTLYVKGTKRNVVRTRKSVDTMIREYRALLKEDNQQLIQDWLQNNPEFDEWISCGLTLANINSSGKDRQKINQLAETNRKLSGHAEAIIYELGLKVGQVYDKNEIKTTIQSYYDRNGIKRKAKGTDISQWFQVKPTTTIINGERKNVIKILSRNSN